MTPFMSLGMNLSIFSNFELSMVWGKSSVHEKIEDSSHYVTSFIL